jgi:sulfur transfer protein SufE
MRKSRVERLTQAAAAGLLDLIALCTSRVWFVAQQLAAEFLEFVAEPDFVRRLPAGMAEITLGFAAGGNDAVSGDSEMHPGGHAEGFTIARRLDG